MPQPHDAYLEGLKQSALRIAEAEAEKVRLALKNTVTPRDFDELTADLQHSVDRIFQEKLIQSGDTIDCQKGCSFCCYFKVDANAWEIFRLVEYIKKRFTAQEIELIHRKAKANREKTNSVTADQRMKLNLACPLLNHGQCSCYNARPLLCRNHHSHRVSLCEGAFNNPGEVGWKETINEIRYPVGAVMWLVREEFEKAGYDSNYYDLSSALDEALSNPKCYKRWRDGRRAFGQDVVAKVPEGDYI